MSEYIKLNKVCFGYKKTGFAVRDVSLMLNRGETTMLLGSNGSGKTTLSKLMIGILQPEKGSVSVDGQLIQKTSLAQTAKKIGYLFQNPDRQLFCTSVLEEIKFSLLHKGESEDSASAHANQLLAEFSMRDKAGEFPLKLSRGEKQRLALLAVFAMRPNFYILDEPSSGIDEENKQKLIVMLKEIKRKGAGMCIITHDKTLTEHLADRVITMTEGRIKSDEITRS